MRSRCAGFTSPFKSFDGSIAVRCLASRVLARLCRYFFLIATPLWAQTFDFEDGVRGWERSGDAFATQPYCGPITSTIFAHIKLGGSYWKNMQYPLAQHGRCLITTIAQPLDTPVGSLTSSEFLLDRALQFLSFRIGGTEDLVRERLELEVRIPERLDSDRVRQIREWSGPFASTADGVYSVVYAAIGHNSESLRQEVVEIPEFLRGLPARIRILDTSSTGHINVDYIQFTSSAPPPLRVPV